MKANSTMEQDGGGQSQEQWRDAEQMHREPWGKRAKRHMMLAQVEIEEMTEMVVNLSEKMRLQGEVLPETISSTQGLTRFAKQLEGSKTSVGLVMCGVSIDAVIPGGPAYATGTLGRFDQVMKVDGMAVNEKTLGPALKGPDTPNTKVRLTVRKAAPSSSSPLQEVEVVLTRVLHTTIGASLRVYDTLDRLKQNAAMVKRFEEDHMMPGQEASWKLVEVLMLEITAQHKRRHEVQESQENYLKESLAALMRHMLSTRQVLTELAQEHLDMVQFAQLTRSALLKRDEEEALIEESLAGLLDQVERYQVEFQELRLVNESAAFSHGELKLEIQSQAAEIQGFLANEKKLSDLKAASSLAAQKFGREADALCLRIAELEAYLRRAESETNALKRQLGTTQTLLREREEEAIFARETHVAQMERLQRRVEMEIVNAQADTKHHGQRVPVPQAHIRQLAGLLKKDIHSAITCVHDLMLAQPVEQEIASEQDQVVIDNFFAVESSVGTITLLVRDAQGLSEELKGEFSKVLDEMHDLKGMQQDSATLEAELKNAHDQLQHVELLLMDDASTSKLMLDVQRERDNLQARIERQDYEMAELEKHLHQQKVLVQERNFTLLQRQEQIELLARRVEEAVQYAGRQGQSTEQVVETLQAALDSKRAELNSVYSGYSRTMLRRQAEQDVNNQTRALAEVLVQSLGDIRALVQVFANTVQEHHVVREPSAKQDAQIPDTIRTVCILSQMHQDSSNEGIEGCISASTPSTVSELELLIQQFEAQEQANSSSATTAWPIEHEMQLVRSLLENFMPNQHRPWLNAILQRIETQFKVSQEVRGHLEAVISRQHVSLASQQHTLAATQSFLEGCEDVTLLYVTLDRARALPLLDSQVESNAWSMRTQTLVGPAPVIGESFVIPLTHPNHEVIFALYAREADTHSLRASLIVPIEELVNGSCLTAWVQLVDCTGSTLVQSCSGEAAAVRLEARLKCSASFLALVDQQSAH